MIVYFLGVDLGGTNIKVGIVDRDCNLIQLGSRPTGMPRSAEAICEDIVAQAKQTIADAGLALSDIGCIGIGCPGSVDDEAGMVRYANNLAWRDVPLKRLVSEPLGGLPTAIGNDANVAAYGEYVAGSAKGADGAVIITLGTGVGSGVIIDSKIVVGHNAAATEFGHMVIHKGGRLCTCGREGCWEAYSSATGLINMTKEAMDRNPGSLMWGISREDGKVSGKTAFKAMRQGDAAGKEVVDEYISYMACGVASVINILQPEIISIGGGVSKEGDPLLLPLREAVGGEVYGSDMATEIRLCTLGNDAGIIGAAMLAAASIQ